MSKKSLLDGTPALSNLPFSIVEAAESSETGLRWCKVEGWSPSVPLGDLPEWAVLERREIINLQHNLSAAP